MDKRKLIERAAREHRLSREEIVCLLEAVECEEELAAAADLVRRAFVGDGVHLRGLIEFSNICRQNCLYCGLRRDNYDIDRFRQTPDEIVQMAEKAVQFGSK